MAYLVLSRVWYEEIIEIGRARMKLRQAKRLLTNAESALPKHATLEAGETAEHGEFWLEIESEEGDLISDPIRTRPKFSSWLVSTVDIPLEFTADERANQLYAELKAWMVSRYGEPDDATELEDSDKSL